MDVKVVLVDLNPNVVRVWKEAFAHNPEVEIVQDSMLNQTVDAWVSPTNSRGQMNGGLDGAIRDYFGTRIQARVRRVISQDYQGWLPVGHATCVATGEDDPKYLISTVTMHEQSENISDTFNVAVAACAAFQAVRMQNEKHPRSIRSVALPGLGAGTGQTPVEMCADLMWIAYNLFRNRAFSNFEQMRAAIREELGEIDPTPVNEQERLRRAVAQANLNHIGTA